FALLLAELDDQDAVLRRQSDQHHHADLPIEIEREAAHDDRNERAEHADRDGQQHGHWNRPAFVQADQEQIGEQDREAEDDGGLAFGTLFLERSVGPFSRKARRQGLRRDGLHGGERLAGRDALRGAALHGHGPQIVVADQHWWPYRETHLGKAAPGNHVAFGVADVDAIDVVDSLAVARFGLDVDLPATAEQVDVVDVVAAKRSLQRLEHVAQLDA